MSIPAPPPAEPSPPAPAVPYGGPLAPADEATASAPVTAQGVAKGVGRVAVTWGIRTVLFLILRAVFKAIFRG